MKYLKVAAFKWAIAWAVRSCGAVYYAVQGGSNFRVCEWNPKVTIKMKATEHYFHLVPLIMLYKFPGRGGGAPIN